MKWLMTGCSFTPHSIGDSIWLEDGALAIAAGNQIYLHTRNIENEEEMTKSLNLLAHRGSNTDIYDIVSHLNGPVPVYHPQFLQQCILAGRTKLVERILVNLHKELRSYHEEIPLELLLNIPQEVFLDPEHGDGEPVSLHRRYSKVGTDFANYTQEDDFSTFSETMAKSLCEYLTKIPIPHLTGSEQMGLAGIIECAAQVSRHRRSIDENGARYLLFFRQWILRQKRLRVPVARNEGGLSWREIVWAFHSVSQEILVDLVSRPHKGKMMWNGARESGLFMWLKDLESVVCLDFHVTLNLRHVTDWGVNMRSEINGRLLRGITTRRTRRRTRSIARCTISRCIRRTSSSAFGA